MRFACDRTTLVEKLSILARGVSTRSALPVLSGILLQARDGRLEMYSTDMELSIKASIATTIETEGEAVVPARLFTDVIKNMAAADVRVEAGDGVVKILAGKAAFSLNSWVASDFPPTSSFDMSEAFSVGVTPFVETLNKVGRAASRDETRPILTGVLVTIGAGKLKMVATDSYRLSVKETPLEGGPADEIQAIVPVKALSEVQRLAPAVDDGELRLVITENQALFAVGDVWIATRLIDGQFPNYRQLLPESFDHEVDARPRRTARRSRGASACWRRRTRPCGCSSAKASSRSGPSPRTSARPKKSSTRRSPASPSRSASTPCSSSRARGRGGDTATLKFTNPLRPGLVTGADESFVYLIMPIRLSS